MARRNNKPTQLHFTTHFKRTLMYSLHHKHSGDGKFRKIRPLSEPGYPLTWTWSGQHSFLANPTKLTNCHKSNQHKIKRITVKLSQIRSINTKRKEKYKIDQENTKKQNRFKSPYTLSINNIHTKDSLHKIIQTLILISHTNTLTHTRSHPNNLHQPMNSFTQ